MATIFEMKKLGRAKQISFPSTPEIVARLDLAAAKIAAEGTTFNGAKLRTGHVVNAVALWLTALDDDDLRDFVVPKLVALEAYLNGDDAASVDPLRHVATSLARVEPKPHSTKDGPDRLDSDDVPGKAEKRGPKR